MSERDQAGAGRLGREFLLMPAGFVAWSACFVLLYACQSLACSAGLEDMRLLGVNLVTAMLVGIVVVHLMLIGGLFWRTFRHHLPRAEGSARTVHLTAAALHASAFVSTVWIGFPVLMLPPCA